MNVANLLAMVIEQRQVAAIQISLMSLGHGSLSGSVPELVALINCLRVVGTAQVLVTDFIDPASVVEGLKPCRDRINGFLCAMALDGEEFVIGVAKPVEKDVYVLGVTLRHVPIQPVAIGVKPE